MKNRPLLLGTLMLVCQASWSAPSYVKVEKKVSGWTLSVDGAPFMVKGVGCNTAEGANKEDYLKMAAAMGANSVRTWGVTPRAYFDRAQELGLKVDSGVWFNPVRGTMADSYVDAAYCKRIKAETLAYVKEMKGHPALLFWNLGNEVFTFTESDVEKKAFALFLEDLVQAVHKEDPNHPVMYSCASPADLSNLKAYVPSIDIVGANTYGGFPWVLRWLVREKFDKPVIATEYGPYGEWDRMKDENHQPYDPTDFNKAKNYEEHWRTIEANPAQALGGYAFVLGDFRNQGSLTWYNVNFGDKKREGYWKLYELYTGKPAPNRCPRIQLFTASHVSGLKPGEIITVSTKAQDPDGDDVTYDYFITDLAADPLIVSPARYFPCEPQKIAPGQARVRVPHDPGVYRVYVSVEDKHGNVAIANRSIVVDPLAR